MFRNKHTTIFEQNTIVGLVHIWFVLDAEAIKEFVDA